MAMGFRLPPVDNEAIDSDFDDRSKEDLFTRTMGARPDPILF